MKNLLVSITVFLLCLVSLSPMLVHADEPTLVDHCYAGVDSEASSAPELYQLVDVKVFLDERGYYAHVENQTTHEVLADKMPLMLQFERSARSAGWNYFSPDLPNKKAQGVLEIYRTELAARSPTMVNAHFSFDYKDKSGVAKTVAAQRLECEKIGL